jgi:threonine dehydrogenase-like Zn-dependent dehydrogenase
VGGFSTHLIATRNTYLYRVPSPVSPTLAALFNPLGAGIKWTVDVARTTIGDRVLILGGGQRGIACAVAALEVGAGWVGVTGFSRDAHKLAVARQFGAQRTIDVEGEDLLTVVREEVGAVDAVIDTTPSSTEALSDALAAVRKGGRIVVAGLKGRPAAEFPVDQLTRKEVALYGVLGTGSAHYRRAIGMIASSRFPLDRLQTHVLPLDQVEYGIQLLAGEVPDEKPINVVISTA